MSQYRSLISLLFQVLPPAAHNIKATASKFLLGWLLEHEHEHRQWTAGISLGLISSSLHVTDHKQKFQNISGLLEVLSIPGSYCAMYHIGSYKNKIMENELLRLLGEKS